MSHWITGGSSGIGRELAIVHAQHGGDSVIVARSGPELDACKRELEEKYGVQVMTVVKDLSQPSAPQALYEEIRAAGVTVEYLINNAGFGGQGRFLGARLAEGRRDDRPQRQGAHRGCCRPVPSRISSRARQGRILATCRPRHRRMPGPLQAVYFATKAYVTSFSQAVAEELSDTHVTVTVLLPKATSTRFARAGGLEDTELFKAQDAWPIPPSSPVRGTTG